MSELTTASLSDESQANNPSDNNRQNAQRKDGEHIKLIRTANERPDGFECRKHRQDLALNFHLVRNYRQTSKPGPGLRKRRDIDSQIH